MSRHAVKQTMTRRDLLSAGARGASLALLGGGVLSIESAPTLGAPAGSAGRVLSVATLLNIKTLDPGRTLENGTNNIAHVTYDTLVTFAGEDLATIRPSLATKWSTSPDGLTYTFTLRPNVKFASGNPMTSADFKWSFERLMHIKGNGAWLLDGVEAVLAPNPTTVVLKLSRPVPALLPILTAPPLSPVDTKVVAANGGDAGPDAKDKDTAEGYLNAHSAGTGAFVLTSYVPNQELVLAKNPTFWRGPSDLDRVVIRNVAEPSAQALMVQKGDVDIAVNIQADQALQLRHVPGVTVRTSPALNVVNIIMNSNPQVGGPFSHPKVRQAIRYAIDYQGVMALAAPGSVRSAGIIPPSFPGARPRGEAAKTDRERARALLKEANLGNVEGTFIYSSTYASFGVDTSILSQKIQHDLAAVGIKVKLVDLPYAVQVQQYRDGKIPMGLGGWLADYMDMSDYLVFLPGRTVGKRLQWFPDSSPEAQEIVKLGARTETEVDRAKAIALYQELDRRISDAGPYIPLYQPAVPYAFRSNVKGVTYNTGWYVDYSTISKT
ncbi:MAG TPA: ABC transporter substrate-binding protein [bacterium]|nr:ABC transporter substrate-binding protein [bacterium]